MTESEAKKELYKSHEDHARAAYAQHELVRSHRGVVELRDSVSGAHRAWITLLGERLIVASSGPLCAFSFRGTLNDALAWAAKCDLRSLAHAADLGCDFSGGHELDMQIAKARIKEMCSQTPSKSAKSILEKALRVLDKDGVRAAQRAIADTPPGIPGSWEWVDDIGQVIAYRVFSAREACRTAKRLMEVQNG